MSELSKPSRFSGLYALLVPSKEIVQFNVYSGNEASQVIALEQKEQKAVTPLTRAALNSLREYLQSDDSYETSAYYNLYLVNESKSSISQVSVNMGGYESYDDELIQTNTVNRIFVNIPSGTRILMDQFDYGMLDMVLWHELELKFTGHDSFRASFVIMKAYALKKEIYVFSKIVGAWGYRFDLERE